MCNGNILFYIKNTKVINLKNYFSNVDEGHSIFRFRNKSSLYDFSIKSNSIEIRGEIITIYVLPKSRNK